MLPITGTRPLRLFSCDRGSLHSFVPGHLGAYQLFPGKDRRQQGQEMQAATGNFELEQWDFNATDMDHSFLKPG